MGLNVALQMDPIEDVSIDADSTFRIGLEAEARGHRWTEGQREAATGLLTGTDCVTGVQGYAGTAKTTTVLATYAEGMRSAGYQVRAIAPTAPVMFCMTTVPPIAASACGVTARITTSVDPPAPH